MFMRAFGQTFLSFCCVASSVLLLSLVCLAQQPDDSQSCTGTPAQSTAPRAEPVALNKGLAVADTASPIAHPHTIKLTWTESISTPSTVGGYYIYRRETGPKCQIHPNHCQLLNLNKPIKGSGCTDYSVVAGHTYIYQAQTVGKNSLTSTFSKDAIAKAR